MYQILRPQRNYCQEQIPPTSGCCLLFTKPVSSRSSNYWTPTVRIHQGDEWKTAFNSSLEYLVMRFGLTNAPAVFWAPNDDVLQDVLNRFLFMYVWLVLQWLLENQLFVKVEKCEFHAASSRFWLSTATGVSRSDKGVCYGWVAHSLLLEVASAVPGLCNLLPSF